MTPQNQPTNFVDNGDGTYCEQTLTPFDPVALQTQIKTIEEQLASDINGLTVAAQTQIASLQATLAAFQAAIPNPSQPAQS
jgi:hypothetical protein